MFYRCLYDTTLSAPRYNVIDSALYCVAGLSIQCGIHKARLCGAVRLFDWIDWLTPRLVYDAAVAMANFKTDLSAAAADLQRYGS